MAISTYSQSPYLFENKITFMKIVSPKHILTHHLNILPILSDIKKLNELFNSTQLTKAI